jgi:hypothetical protein
MRIESKPNCPLNQFQPCKQLECSWFLKINGKNPNTGEPIDEWGCSMAWLPILLINSAKEQRSTSAAVESFRNEMVKANDINNKIMFAATLADRADNAQIPKLKDRKK